jgi:ATP sulfurylase
MFVNNENIPEEFSRPEVVAVLREYYAGSHANAQRSP